MCGRFTLTAPTELHSRFKTSNKLPEGLKANYNAAPTQHLPVIMSKDGKNKIEIMHWGLIPVWAKDNKRFAFSTINARAESLLEKPMWKKLVESKRCLVPATGFYEWKKLGAEKQPYYIQVKDQSIFALAGLYDEWTAEGTGEVISSFSIITTTPNTAMKGIHDRMPVILNEEEEGTWLDQKYSATDVLPLLNPYPSKDIELHPVDKAVGKVSNNSIELTYPLNEGA